MHAALFSYMWRCGEQCHGADGHPGESCSSRDVVARHVLVKQQFRGWRCSGWSSGRRRGPIQGCRQRGGAYAAQWQSWRRLLPGNSNSIGMSSQCPAWCGSGGDGRTGLTATRRSLPPAWRHGVALCSHGKGIRGCRRPPSRARRVSRMWVGGTVSRG
jgi:hypothetical protein